MEQQNNKDIKEKNNDCKKKTLIQQQEVSKALLSFLAERSNKRVPEIQKKIRKREIVFERQKFYYLCKVNKICSLQLASSYFGQKHANAIHGYKTICNLMETNKAISLQMKTLDRLVKEFVLNLRLFTWIENSKTKLDEMFYKGELVGFYDKNSNQYKIICNSFSDMPNLLEKDKKVFIENEFLRFLDKII